MTLWRDDTPQPVQDDLDGLAETALDTAQHFLGKNGEFFPFGVTVTAVGDQRMEAADPDLGEHPESQVVLDLLCAGIHAERESLRAAAFVSDVLVDGSDAISVRMEHRDGGPAMVILQSYQKKRFSRGIELGAISITGVDRRIWRIG